VALLGYLVAERRPTARDLLAALFWPDEAQSKGRGNLRRELHNLSQILPDCWQMERQAVAFIPTGDTAVDIYTLMKLEAEERWGEAVELLGGEFLEGLYLDDNLEFETWLLGERERWRVRTEAVLTRVIEGHTLRGQYADALQHCQRLLQLAPWNEGTHRQVMRLLAWTGQRGAALRQYDTCNQVLKEELDVEPSAETEALYHQIRDSILDVPPQLPAFLTEEGARHEIDRPLFVAREHELTQLESFLDAALDGQGRMVFITGGPGRGKTALMNAFGQRAMETHPDLLVASGWRC
jgi:DNA-binding SARP family transcriptional activator